MAASNTYGKTKKKNLAPKVKAPNPKKPNYMREADTPSRLKSPMAPMKSKRLSK